MTHDELARAKHLAWSDLREAAKFIASLSGVDPDELLEKLPEFPVDPNEPEQFAGFMAELKVRTGNLTATEIEIMTSVSALMVEVLGSTLPSDSNEKDSDLRK